LESASIVDPSLHQPTQESCRFALGRDVGRSRSKAVYCDAVDYSPKISNSDFYHQIIESALQSADPDNEFALCFQPIVHLCSGRVRGFEALARWKSPQLGSISPDIFIPLAERAGIISKLTFSILKKAFAAATMWPESINLSVNISALEISSSVVMREIIAILSESNVDPQRINFEITETSAILDIDVARLCILELKEYGCGVCLDDFGVGFANLAQLQLLPVTSVKVDRRFTAGVHESRKGFNIIKSILNLSSDMELDCIVEGVECVDELKALMTLGCESAQGFYFSEPLLQADVLAFIEKSKM